MLVDFLKQRPDLPTLAGGIRHFGSEVVRGQRTGEDVQPLDRRIPIRPDLRHRLRLHNGALGLDSDQCRRCGDNARAFSSSFGSRSLRPACKLLRQEGGRRRAAPARSRAERHDRPDGHEADRTLPAPAGLRERSSVAELDGPGRRRLTMGLGYAKPHFASEIGSINIASHKPLLLKRGRFCHRDYATIYRTKASRDNAT